MQHEFCCVNLIGRSWRACKKNHSNTHIPCSDSGGGDGYGYDDHDGRMACGYGGMAMAPRMVQGGRIGVTPVRRGVVAGMAALHITGQPAVRAGPCVATMQMKELETAFCWIRRDSI